MLTTPSSSIAEKLCDVYRSLKNVRRRVVETVLEGVGATERTVDEDYDSHVEHFTSMLDDMNECTT